MTTLDPSHIPGLHRTDDPKTGQAVYNSVSPLHALSGHLAEQDRAFRPRRRRADSLDADDEDASSDDEDDHRRERVPVPPIPDLRFEQGVLASIRPFLHRADGSGEADSGAGEKKGRLAAAEKGALASANLTAEGGAAGEGPSDVFMAPRIEWSKVTYVLLRDQVIFPLLQGVLWGVAGFYLGAVWDWNKGRLAAKARGSGRPSLLRSVGIGAR
ncbi:hypothetical protein JCM10450v2_000638 [Rhodotorula kratochvilovae]